MLELQELGSTTGVRERLERRVFKLMQPLALFSGMSAENLVLLDLLLPGTADHWDGIAL